MDLKTLKQLWRQGEPLPFSLTIVSNHNKKKNYFSKLQFSLLLDYHSHFSCLTRFKSQLCWKAVKIYSLDVTEVCLNIPVIMLVLTSKVLFDEKTYNLLV